MAEIRLTLRAAGAALVALGAALVAYALSQPWSWRAGASAGHPGVLLTVAIALAGPGLSLVRAIAWWRGARDRRLSVVAMAGAAGAGGLTWLAMSHVGANDGIRATGPMALLGCAAIAVGWLLVAVTGPALGSSGEHPLLRWSIPAAVAAVLVVAGAVGATRGIAWYTQERFVVSRTAPPLPDAVSDAPATLDHESWRVDLARIGPTLVAGRSLLVAGERGVMGHDVLTGQHRWSYQRRDRSISALGVSSDGGTTVVAYGSGDSGLAVALETGTGRPRWQRWYPGTTLGPRLIGVGDLVVSAPAAHSAGATFTALDADTGAIHWKWAAVRDGRPCELGDSAASEQTVAVAMRCRSENTVSDVVIGLSTVDGTERWQRAVVPASAELGSTLFDVTLHPVGDKFLVEYPRTGASPAFGVVLDGSTGAPSGEHPAPGAFVAVAGRTALYLGTDLASVDLSSGKTRWSRPATEFSGWKVIGAADLAGAQYLLLRGPSPTENGTGGGQLRLVSLNLTTGEVRADRSFLLWPDGCGNDPTGRPHCPVHTADLWLAPGLLVVAEHAERTRFAAFG